MARCWVHADNRPGHKYFISASNEKFKQIIHAAIRATINDHGPITSALSGSFSKRLMALMRERTVFVTKQKMLAFLVLAGEEAKADDTAAEQ
jgi:hypothetical protein